MSLKEELIKIRTKITGNTEEVSMITPISLDDKVDEFIDWYFKNMVKGNYTDIGEYHFPRKMRDLIEKIAVWYELRYPSYEINRLIPGSGQEQINVNDVMFRNNPYVNELLDENSDAKELDWDDFYNVNVFMKSLPWEERCYFSKPRYRDIVYLNPNSRVAHLHLTKNGSVEMAEDITGFTKSAIKEEELSWLNVRDIVKLFKDKGIELPENNELEKTINEANKWIQQKEGILDCAMYRIIERGGNRIGPRRAFLFAKEFGRNIDIPMMYAIDRSDPGLRLFMNEYLKAGGSKDLVCYNGYFSRASKKEKVDTISIQELILTQNNNAATFYTPEEHDLHQRIVNAIASQVDHEVVRQEEVKRLRLERKIEKSRTRQQ